MMKKYWLMVLCAAAALAFGACSKPEDSMMEIGGPSSPGGAGLPGTTPDAGQTGSLTPGLPGENPDPSASPNPTKTPHNFDGVEAPGQTPVPQFTYEEAKKLNSDVIGWISVPNSKVNYPVVQTKDNDYYLGHSIDKSESKGGTIFLDTRCSTNGKHLMIFGHNMRVSKTMFHGVTQYTESNFYKNNRQFTVTFGDKKETYKVFSVYSMDVKLAQQKLVHAVDSDFPDDAAFAKHMNDLAKLSKYTVDTTIAATDKVVTLMTCDRQDYENGRLFIHAVKVG